MGKVLGIQRFHDFLIFAEMRSTDLIWASYHGQGAIVKLLIEAGAELETKDDNG